jgi:hypothetical protein
MFYKLLRKKPLIDLYIQRLFNLLIDRNSNFIVKSYSFSGKEWTGVGLVQLLLHVHHEFFDVPVEEGVDLFVRFVALEFNRDHGYK